jgi:Bacterial membrane protein YfhO
MTRHLGGAWLATACVVGLTLACFGPALGDGRQFAFRDFSDFYYPLYQRVQQEWEAGRLPLWAAEENGGTPMLANPTSAVLYPGKLIYAVFPYPRAAKAYVVAHILLAFGAMVALLRRSEVSMVGSTLGGLAYAFGAPVLTQYCNIVFLVGAAWMPLGFRFADGWIRLRRPRAIAGLALVLAMQVLGGDPEAAYLTAFASGAYAVGRWLFQSTPGRPGRVALAALGLVIAYGALLALEVAYLPDLTKGTISTVLARTWWQLSPSAASLIAWVIAGLIVFIRWLKKRGRPGLESSLLGLLAACVLGAALTGAQLVPTLEYVTLSSRSEEALRGDLYSHSIHPARLVEWAWPNFFGATRYNNRNWLTSLPPTSNFQIWMSSIYLGGLTCLLAMGAAVGSRSCPAIRGWMIGVALVGVLAGFGSFASPLFWARAVSGTEGHLGTLEKPEPELPRPDGRLRDGDSGPYWFLATSLPGFRSFRYPGKLFVPAALGLAVLAGMGFDGLVAGRRRAASALAWALLVAGLVGLSLSVGRKELLLEFLKGRSGAIRSVFGPFDPIGAASDMRSALIHGSVVIVAFLALARIAPRRPLTAGILALGVMTVDLALANRSEVATVSQSAYEPDSPVLAAIQRSERENPEPGPFRIYRILVWEPSAWTQVTNPDRLEQIVRWQCETLRPNHQQPLRVSSTYSVGTANLSDYSAFFVPLTVKPGKAQARRLNVAEGGKVNYFFRRSFDLWNTRYFILPNRFLVGDRVRGFASLLPNCESIYPIPFTGSDAPDRLERWGQEMDVQVLRNLAAYPRAWVVHQAIPLGPAGTLTRAERVRLMVALLYQDDMIWHEEGREVADPRRVAWVEASDSKLAGLAGALEGSEPVKVVETDDPTRVKLEVTLQSPGLIVLADVFYPGWRLEIDGRPTEILRVDQMMRGAVVPAGSHRLVYTYHPASLVLGIALSAVGLLVWLGLLAFGRARMELASPRTELPGQDSNLEKQDQNLL